MAEKLDRLLEEARKHKMDEQEKEEQRRSFAFGNANIENDQVTRDEVNEAAAEMGKEAGGRE